MSAPAGIRGVLRSAAPAFLLSASLGRVPQAMMAVCVLTFLPSAGGDFALAGLAAGAVGIGSALGAPVFGLLVDKTGPKRVLIAFAALQAAAFLGFIASAPALTRQGGGGATALLLLHAGLIGAACPQIGAVARVVWRQMFGTGPQMGAAMSYESTVDELSFALGPVLVGLCASFISPFAPLVLSAVLVISMVLVLVGRIPSVQMEHGSAGPRRLKGAPAAVVALCALAMVSMGTVFGGTLTSLLPFATARGIPDATGLLYGGMSLASAVFALSMPLWSQKVPPIPRWIGLGAALLAAAFAVGQVNSVVGMVVALFILGIPVGPTMVTVFETAGLVAPAGILATVMTLLGSGIVVGTALSSAAAGALASAGGSSAAFLVPLAGAAGILLTGSLLALFGRRALTAHS